MYVTVRLLLFSSAHMSVQCILAKSGSLNCTLFTCSLANRISLNIIDSCPVWEIHVTWLQNIIYVSQFHGHLCRVTDPLVTQFEIFTCKSVQPQLSNPSCPTHNHSCSTTAWMSVATLSVYIHRSASWISIVTSLHGWRSDMESIVP